MAMTVPPCCMTGGTLKAYRIVRPLGKGGYARVYEAIDRARRRVAIKQVSLANLSAESRQVRLAACQREAYFLSRLHHPHLPELYHFFQERDSLYLVMQLIEGETLQRYVLSRGRSLSLAEVLDIGVQLAEVLAYLHRHSPPIIFRDLKPANIIRTPTGRVVLVDFGLARFYKEGWARDTAVLGTPGYAPPEQHGLGQTDQRSDLYALGATLYYLCTGEEHEDFCFPRLFWPSNPAGNKFGWLLQQLLAYDIRHRRFCAACVKAELEALAWECQRSPYMAGGHIWPSRVQCTTRPACHTHAGRSLLWKVALVVAIGLALGVLLAVIQGVIQAALR
jgi:serine/threonine protein kinase